MQIELTAAVAVRMFDAWCRELESMPGLRAVNHGEVKLDSVPSQSGVGENGHTMDGSVVKIVYHAANPASARAVREAQHATASTRMPREVYHGRLVDIKRGQDGTVYFKARTISRHSESNNHQPAYRAFNPSKGQLVSMVINPNEEAGLEVR